MQSVNVKYQHLKIKIIINCNKTLFFVQNTNILHNILYSVFNFFYNKIKYKLQENKSLKIQFHTHERHQIYTTFIKKYNCNCCYTVLLKI